MPVTPYKCAMYLAACFPISEWIISIALLLNGVQLKKCSWNEQMKLPIGNQTPYRPYCVCWPARVSWALRKEKALLPSCQGSNFGTFCTELCSLSCVQQVQGDREVVLLSDGSQMNYYYQRHLYLISITQVSRTSRVNQILIHLRGDTLTKMTPLLEDIRQVQTFFPNRWKKQEKDWHFQQYVCKTIRIVK